MEPFVLISSWQETKTNRSIEQSAMLGLDFFWSSSSNRTEPATRSTESAWPVEWLVTPTVLWASARKMYSPELLSPLEHPTSAINVSTARYVKASRGTGDIARDLGANRQYAHKATGSWIIFRFIYMQRLDQSANGTAWPGRGFVVYWRQNGC